jgi:hypothetical protein
MSSSCFFYRASLVRSVASMTPSISGKIPKLSPSLTMEIAVGYRPLRFGTKRRIGLPRYTLTSYRTISVRPCSPAAFAWE